MRPNSFCDLFCDLMHLVILDASYCRIKTDEALSPPRVDTLKKCRCPLAWNHLAHECASCMMLMVCVGHTYLAIIALQSFQNFQMPLNTLKTSNFGAFKGPMAPAT